MLDCWLTVFLCKTQNDGRDGGNESEYRTEEGLQMLNVKHNATFHQYGTNFPTGSLTGSNMKLEKIV